MPRISDRRPALPELFGVAFAFLTSRGSPARMPAALSTLIETAKLNGIDPQAWLADLLARLPDYPAKRIDDLLSWNWTQPQPTQSPPDTPSEPRP